MKLKPNKGGFLRPFGAGWFIREYLLGNGPQGSNKIDRDQGAVQADINSAYREALARATAQTHAESIISRMVLKGEDVTEEKAKEIYERELKKTSFKFSHMRYHSFLMYFEVLKKLGWVEATGKTEPSSIKDDYPQAPDRTYYRLTGKGIQAGKEAWANPLFTLYPQIGPNHSRKTETSPNIASTAS